MTCSSLMGQPTPMMLMLNTHFSHAKDTVVADLLVTDPPVPIRGYRDSFGNWCTRIVAPKVRPVVVLRQLIKESVMS